MTEPVIPDLVVTRSFTDRGRRGVKQVVTCDVAGCTNEMVTTATKGLKPGDQVLNMARRRGWIIDKHGRTCPKHKGREKELSHDQIADLAQRFKVWFECPYDLKSGRKDLLLAELKRLGLSKVTEAKTEADREALLGFLDNQTPEDAAMPQTPNDTKTLKPLSESLKLPTEAARAQRRKVFHEIDDSYENGRYREGVTDATIAQKLLVAVTMVAEIREQNFGPAGPDPRIIELRKQVANLETRVEQVEAAGLAALEHAEAKAKEFRRDIASLLDRINKLEGVL